MERQAFTGMNCTILQNTICFDLILRDLQEVDNPCM
jgi:hypothetical protein